MSSNSDNIYALNSDDGGEVRLGVSITWLGVDSADLTAGTFGGPVELSAWRIWLKDYFEPLILPTFQKIYAAAASMQHREIMALDLTLSESLTAEMTQRSVSAGKIFRGTKADVKHLPQWVRFEEKLNTGDTPGHLPTLLAVQAACFNVPIHTALISYGLAEWLGARPENSDQNERAINLLKPVIQKSSGGGLHSI